MERSNLMPKYPGHLRALARDCEIDPPSRQLDRLIADTILPSALSWLRPIAVYYCPFYSTDLSSAMRIAPPNWLNITISDIAGDGLSFVKLGTPSFVERHIENGIEGNLISTREAVGVGGRTLALTYCAAALRALHEELTNAKR